MSELNMEAERAALCQNCRTVTTCLEMGCGQGRDAQARTAPVSAPLDTQALPPLPEGDEYSATRMLQNGELAPRYNGTTLRNFALSAIAPYAERIRHLERELAERKPASIGRDRDFWKRMYEWREAWLNGPAERLTRAADDLIAYIDGRTAPCNPTPIAWMLKTGHGTGWRDSAPTGEFADKWIPLIDGRTAGTATAWLPIETKPANMASRLYWVDGFCVQGFVDATGELMAQSEVSPHWRKMRGKPTHWMPLPAAPSPLNSRKEEA